MKIPEHIGGIHIFRSARQFEDQAYERIKSAFFKAVAPGRYTEKKEIQSLVNLKYKLYEDLLNENLYRIDPNFLVGFLIEQYELYGQVAEAYKEGRLTVEEDEFWCSYALSSRRGMKYLLELICASNLSLDHVTNDPEEQAKAVSLAFIAAEEVVNLYMHNHYYAHIADDFVVILDPTQHTYFATEKLQKVDFDPRAFAKGTDLYIPAQDPLLDIAIHGAVLDAPFTEHLGISYQNIVHALNWIIEKYSDKNNPEAIGHFVLAEVVDVLVENFGATSNQAKRVIDGFSLNAAWMATEGRKLFRPKQEYRAYKRAFFQHLHRGREHVFFSRRMAQECVQLLVSQTAFKKIPPEWCSPKIKKTLEQLSFQAGRWFQNVIKDNFVKVGIEGKNSFERYTLNDGTRISIPLDVGDIDFLGFCIKQKMLIVVEAKQVGMATEPRMYLDDHDKFISSDKNYRDKFKKKIDWTVANRDLLVRYIQETFAPSFEAATIAYIMIVRYPLFIADRISDFPCVTLVDFMTEYESNDHRWPYGDKGIYVIPMG
jgi:hypothetical protein